MSISYNTLTVKRSVFLKIILILRKPFFVHILPDANFLNKEKSFAPKYRIGSNDF